MGYANLSACVADLEKTGQLKRIDIELDPRLEMAVVQRRAFARHAPALLFTRPKGSPFPMLANLFGTRERTNYIFRDALENVKQIFTAGADPASILRKPLKHLPLLLACAHARPIFRHCRSSLAKAPVLARQCSLHDLPRLVSWPKDGGAFITLPLVYSEDSRGRANLGMYRVQISGGDYAADEAGLHYQLQRGIGIHHAEALAHGKNLAVHVYVGGPPALTLAAIMPLPEGMSEIMFAGLLGGRRMSLARSANFDLPVLSECDFLIQGEITSGLKPEGPFGDHMGYYSLRHDFPVLKVKRVCHRSEAIWPFTSVGRPPQEDTIFGDIIHELTAPMVSQVFNGVKEVHAVDAAGVHPLLLAIGEERYTPWENPGRPRELLTQGLHLLGSTQTALAKYLLITDGRASPDLTCGNVKMFFRHMLERADYSNDLHFLTRVNCDTLDYTGTGLNEGSKLLWASAGDKRRELFAEAVGLVDLPDGFGSAAVVGAGILAIQASPHRQPRGESDPAIENDLAPRLQSWAAKKGFPLVVVVDDADFCAQSFENFLWITFTRSDPATDIYGVGAFQKNRHWGCAGPLIIDARQKIFHAPPLEEDPATVARLEKLACRGGPLSGLI